MTTLNIFTSARGGLGKTMVGSSIAWALNENNRVFLAIDMNWQNPDFSRILILGTKRIGPNSPNIVLYKPNEGFAVCRRSTKVWDIPHGNSGIWDDILNLYDAAKPNLANCNHILVDTCSQATNILQIDMAQIVRVKEGLLERGITHVNIWFLWSFAELYTQQNFNLAPPHSVLDLLVDQWNQQDHGHNAAFSLVPYHVINHKTFRDENPWYRVQFGLGFENPNPTDDNLVAIQKLRYRPDIELSFEDMHSYFGDVLNNTNFAPQERMSTIYDALVAQYNGRPKNLVVIAHHAMNAYDFPASLIREPPNTLDAMIKPIQPMAEDIKLFVRNMLGLN